MGLSDFERCTPSEFRAVYDAWHGRAESLEQGEWEQTRLLCACILQDRLKQSLDVREVLPLPWDKKHDQSPARDLSNAELKTRYEAAKKRYGLK